MPFFHFRQLPSIVLSKSLLVLSKLPLPCKSMMPCGINQKRIVTGIFGFIILVFVFNFRSSRLFLPENVKNSCTLPKINFYDRSLDTVFANISTGICANWQDLVFFDNNGVLRMNDTEVRKSGHADLKCGYSEIHLLEHNQVSISDTVVFNIPSRTNSEAVHVQCYNTDGVVIYSNLHYKLDTKTTLGKRKLQEESNDQLSLIFLGLDSVSRIIGERKLLKTLPYMRDELGAYVFKGYTKVGDNTLPNIIATLTGKSLFEALLPTSGDNQYLYKAMLKKGYIDCHAEDSFNNIVSWLVNIPYYTHYLRKLFLASNHVQMFMKDPVDLSEKFTNGSKLCFGNKFLYKILLDQTKKCIEVYEGKLKYVHMWQNELAHNDPNVLQYADEDFKTFLRWMKKTNKLDRAVVILFGDHGTRYGSAVENDIIRFTGRLPLFSILIPEQLKQRFPHLHKNLLLNRERLTTPFDVHETLKDILYQNFEPRKRDYKLNNMPRGISLFQEIPENRTCFDAGVSEHYCPCYSFSQVSTENKIVLELSRYVVFTLNQILVNDQDKCAKLELYKVLSAKLQHVPKTGSESQTSTNYVLNLETVPGNGVFEATAQYDSNGKMKVLGDIDRLNRYGNQANCIETPYRNDINILIYCHCINKDDVKQNKGSEF